MEEVHSNWVSNIDLVRQFVTPKTFLGEEDAEAEWGGEQKPVNLFLHTNSYETFMRNDSLYLFGRRGTGKTAMMHMLHYEIATGQSPYYSYAWLIDEETAYNELATSVRGSPLADLPKNELVHMLVDKWLWVLKLAAMAAVVTANKNQKEDKDITLIAKYLKDQNFLDSETTTNFEWITNPIVRLTTVLQEELGAIDYVPTKIGLALTKCTLRLCNPDYGAAQEALGRIMKKSKGACLVMVDAMQLYALHDAISEAVITALIEAARKMYIARLTDRILVKAAFPSEIYPRLTALNLEKMEGRNVFIIWTYPDLICLLAKRYWQMIHKNTNPAKQLDDSKEARNFLYQYFPRQIATRGGMRFDTLAYIIRHTQKKPRQVILLLNVLLTLAEESIDISKKLPPNWIVDGIHARLDILVKGDLNMFDMIYKDAEQLVRRSLTDAPSYFDASCLDRLLKETSALRAAADLDKEDIKRLLLECGAIGLVVRKHALTEQRKELLEVLFEYQVKLWRHYGVGKVEFGKPSFN